MRNRPSDFLPLVHALLPQKHHRVCEHRAFAPLGPIWLRSASQTQQRGRGAPGATWLSAAAPHAARNGRSTAATPVPDPGCAAPPHSFIPTPPGSARPLRTQKTKRIRVGPREPRSRGAEGEPLSLRSRGHGGTGKSDKTERGKRTAHLAVDHHHVPLIASAGRAARSAGPAAGLRGAQRRSALPGGRGRSAPAMGPRSPPGSRRHRQRGARSAARREERSAGRGRAGCEGRAENDGSARRGARSGMCAVPARLHPPHRARTPTPGLHLCSRAVRTDARLPACGFAPVVLHLPREWAHKQRPPWMHVSPPPGVQNGSRVCASDPVGVHRPPVGVDLTPGLCTRAAAPWLHVCSLGERAPGSRMPASSCPHCNPRALSTSRLFGFSLGRFELQEPQRKAALRPRRGVSGGLQGFGSTVLLCKAINRRAEGRETGHCWERFPRAPLPGCAPHNASNEASTALHCAVSIQPPPLLSPAPEMGAWRNPRKKLLEISMHCSMERQLVRQRRLRGAGLPWKQ